ncbi:MAG: SufE family protein [Myxococcota bacterium]
MERIVELPATSDELEENFALFDDWEDRYTYLVDLGKRLPELPADQRTEENKVRGCTSQVWFVPLDGGDGRLWWAGDSDASIVRGLVAVLQVLFNGRTRDEVRAVDIDAVFARLGLERHLSVSRRNGFYSMVAKLRGWADR